MEWLKEYQKIINDAANVLVVGGGALGIRSCSFISVYACATHNVCSQNLLPILPQSTLART
jgi:hypothetical protein